MAFCAPSSFLSYMIHLTKIRNPTGNQKTANIFLLKIFLMYLVNHKYKAILNGELEII